uniref:Potassium calcium-activated channel subfamily U member 1 n=1 Tax=Nothoprocta perdicaria TaxID=30464 RepID=A0A8C6ZJN9_NOTPE
MVLKPHNILFACFQVILVFFLNIGSLMVYFLVAADDKLRFWLELNSLVDFFTIPPVFVSYYLKKNWLENNGDPWVYPENSQSLSYFKCMYLVMVTMSTVGYGDVVVKTALGRTFIIFFIIGGLVLFANFSPEVVEIVKSHKNYKSSYEVVSGKNYIVVCGNITLESVTAFLQDFLLQDKGNICTEILFLGESLPSLELEAVFKCYSAYTTFFYGSALNLEDLKRVGDVSAASTHFVLGFALQVYLQNIPNWGWRTGDDIICLAELKLGFIAQSCLVPGLTNLLTNLFIGKEKTEVPPLLVSASKHNGLFYCSFRGRSQKVTFRFSCIVKSLEQKSFQEQTNAVILCSVKYKPFLPKPFLFSRAHFYCKACHSDIENPEQIKKCHCKGRLRPRPFSGNFFNYKTCKDEALHNLQDHILVCVFGDANSPLIGLQDFVMPLRASNFVYRELKDIVFLGPLEYLQREWKFIQNFPKLCALSCPDLRAVRVQHCAACAILSANSAASSSPSLVDTESILATLNVRSMQSKPSSLGTSDALLLGNALGSQQDCPLTQSHFLFLPFFDALLVNTRWAQQMEGEAFAFQTFPGQ